MNILKFTLIYLFLIFISIIGPILAIYIDNHRLNINKKMLRKCKLIKISKRLFEIKVLVEDIKTGKRFTLYLNPRSLPKSVIPDEFINNKFSKRSYFNYLKELLKINHKYSLYYLFNSFGNRYIFFIKYLE